MKPKVICIKISEQCLQEELPTTFDNKLVLSFEGTYTPTQTRSWIDTFNISSLVELIYIDSLVNALFVAKVIAGKDGDDKDSLLNQTHGKVEEHFATFNRYHTTFNSLKPGTFFYLIVVLIRKATSTTTTFLEEVFAPFGEVVDREIAQGLEHFKIVVLIVTTERTFERDALVEFEDGKMTKLAFKFFRPFSRCPFCFMLEHLAKAYTS